jgi:hypothetical protein
MYMADDTNDDMTGAADASDAGDDTEKKDGAEGSEEDTGV